MTLSERHERGDHWAGRPHKLCPLCRTEPGFAEMLAKRNREDEERKAFWAARDLDNLKGDSK